MRNNVRPAARQIDFKLRNSAVQDKTIMVRLGLILALCFLGIFFPLFFVVAAWLGWTIYDTLKNPQPPPPDEWYARRWTTTAADPRWRSDFLAFCESPAETKFLDAIIDAYGLIPDNGVLKGTGLTLDLQVEVKPYRLDFLANAWLAVEVDGAAYHSSPEAVARDKERDEFLRAEGYTVLRIPAKVVFATPEEAVGRVRSAIAAGRTSLNASVAGYTPPVAVETIPRSVQQRSQDMPLRGPETNRALAVAASPMDPETQNRLGVMYWDGRGVPQNEIYAVRLWRNAADKGYVHAQINLATATREGRGTPQSDAVAARLYRLAADQGDANAQNQLAFMYREGRGVPQCDVEAARLCRLAADQGHADAQYQLALMYQKGRAVLQNNDEAARLFRLASEQGSAKAQLDLSLMYLNGHGVEQSDEEAARLCRLAADQGNVIAQNNLATMYRDGRGVRRSDKEAARFFCLAAEQGIAQAQNNLGIMYRDGRGVAQSDGEAVRLFRLAADQGNALAKENLALMQQKDRGRHRAALG